MNKQIIRCLLLSLLFATNTLSASDSDEVKQLFSIYGWLPTLEGTMIYSNPSDPSEPSDPDERIEASIIDSVDFVFMGSYGIQKNNWSFLADFIYLGMSGDSASRITNVNYDIKFSANIYGFYGGYRLFQTENTTIDFIAGMRTLGIDLDVFRSGGLLADRKFNAEVNVNDAVVGISGNHRLNKNWHIPFRVDIGSGDSDLTWQFDISLAYKYSWGDIVGTYRYIHFEKDDSLLIEEFDLFGPKIGVIFYF